MTSSDPTIGEQNARVARLIIWFAMAIAGTLAAFLATLTGLPSWLAWVLKGTGGQGQAWLLFGGMGAVCGSIESLAWLAYRLRSRRLAQASMIAGLILATVFVVVGIALILFLGSLQVAMISKGIADLLPFPIADTLQSLDRGRAPYAVAVVIFATMCITFVNAYRTAVHDAANSVVERVGKAVVDTLLPFGLLAMIGLSSFVWLGLIVLVVPHWTAMMSPSWSAWLDARGRALSSIMMIACLTAPVAIYFYRTTREHNVPEKSNFSAACWMVHMALLAVAGVVIAAALSAIAVQYVIGACPRDAASMSNVERDLDTIGIFGASRDTIRAKL